MVRHVVLDWSVCLGLVPFGWNGNPSAPRFDSCGDLVAAHFLAASVRIAHAMRVHARLTGQSAGFFARGPRSSRFVLRETSHRIASGRCR
jgi:hypothetical protein